MGSTTVERREVVVVGGGPAGSTTAAYLAQAGHDVLLLERAVRPQGKACSELSSPALSRELASLGAAGKYFGAGPALIASTNVVTAGGSVLPLRYSGAPRPGVSATSMLRMELDPMLLEFARRQGVEVRLGCRAVPLIESGRCAGVEVASPHGGTSTIRAALTIGADGVHSLLACRAGGRRAMLWPRRLGLSVHYEGVDWPEQLCEMHVGNWAYAGISPTSSGLTSVGVGIDLRRAGAARNTPAELFDLVLAQFPAVSARLGSGRRVDRIRGVGPMAYTVERAAGGGWALVGDAAGFTDPFTGEGIYRAVRGARLAAEVYSPALRGRVSEPESVYARERRSVFAHKAVVVKLIQLFISYPALLEYAAPRLAGRPEVLARFTSVLADCSPASLALRPSFVLAALRP